MTGLKGRCSVKSGGGPLNPRAAKVQTPKVKKRMSYDQSFKLHVVHAALQRPADNRIKPTCALFPGIEPCQLRKWIRNFEAMQQNSTAPKRPTSDASPTVIKKQQLTRPELVAAPYKRVATSTRVRVSDVKEVQLNVMVPEAQGESQGESEDDECTDTSSWSTSSPNSPPLVAAQPNASVPENALCDTQTNGVPLLPQRSVSLTPDKVYRAHPGCAMPMPVESMMHGGGSVRNVSGQPQLLQTHLENTMNLHKVTVLPASLPMPGMVTALPYKPPEIVPPGWKPTFLTVHSARNCSAEQYSKQRCPLDDCAPSRQIEHGLHAPSTADLANAALLNVFGDDSVEDWIDEWLQEMAPCPAEMAPFSMHESVSPCMC